MINWNKIEIIKDNEGKAFWREQTNPNKPELNKPYSRDIEELIITIQRIEKQGDETA